MPGNKDYYRGNLAAYIELLNKGIRDICFPSASACRKTQISYVDKEARKSGFYTLLVTFKRIRLDGRKFRSYQRIVYRSGRRVDAELLRRRLQKTPKDRTDHIEIGRLLGYSREAVNSFIKAKPVIKDVKE